MNSTYAAERRAEADEQALRAYLRQISATHYRRYAMRPQEVEAYKPTPDGDWLACTLLAPNKRTPRWRYKAGWGWRPERLPDGAISVLPEGEL